MKSYRSLYKQFKIVIHLIVNIKKFRLIQGMFLFTLFTFGSCSTQIKYKKEYMPLSLKKDSLPLENIPDSHFIISKDDFIFMEVSTKEVYYNLGKDKEILELLTQMKSSEIPSSNTIFSEEQTNEILKILNDFEELTHIKIGIFSVEVVNDISSIESYFKWDTSDKSQTGLSIIYNTTNEKLNLMRGFSFYEKLSKKKCEEIMNSIMISEFKKGDFFQGTKKGLLAIFEVLKQP